jgi:NAD(P)-dependent dehydrogenase (short-subunit alcohol dehydrogenase family)
MDMEQTPSGSDRKIALITGAGKGLGREVSRQLAALGVHVILSARTLEKAKASAKAAGLNSDQCTALALEVTDEHSVENARSQLTERFAQLDILVNNAAISKEALGSTTISSIPMSTLKETFDSNFFGVVRVTQTLLPLLMKSSAARVVNVGSTMGSLQMQGDPRGYLRDAKTFAYNSSKTALNALTVHLAMLWDGTAHKANTAHPGWAKTDMGTERAPMEIADGAKTIVQLALLDESGPSGAFIHMDRRIPW